MGKRYYCDYCDKSFADNLTSRTNHLKGFTHQKFRQEHFNLFKDPEVILREQLVKKPCRKINNGDECEFGDSCRFSHLTPARRQQLEIKIQKKRAQETKLKSLPVATMEEWLVKREKVDTIEQPASASTHSRQVQLPDELAALPNVPLSLLPPNKRRKPNIATSEWG